MSGTGGGGLVRVPNLRVCKHLFPEGWHTQGEKDELTSCRGTVQSAWQKPPVRRKGGRAGLPARVSGRHVVRGRQSSPTREVRLGEQARLVKNGQNSGEVGRQLSLDKTVGLPSVARRTQAKTSWNAVQQICPHHGDALLDGNAHSVRYGEMIHDGSGQPDSANYQEGADSETFVMGSDAAEFANKVKDQVRKRQKRMSNVADSGEEHSIIWGMFMAATMNAATLWERISLIMKIPSRIPQISP